MRHVRWLLIALVILALGLAACGDDDDTDEGVQNDAADVESTEEMDLTTGPDLAVGGEAGSTEESRLPGCSDPDSEECPNPVIMDLDASASAGGVSVSYPERYFDAATSDDGVLITITPSENNRFEQEAVFEIYFADSIEDALGELTDPETGEWSNDALTGTIGVVRDDAQDPPVNTTIGAFDLTDGRTVVVKLRTTGQYGWDLWSRVYTDILDSLVFTE
jgi:hypothetical protein